MHFRGATALIDRVSGQLDRLASDPRRSRTAQVAPAAAVVVVLPALETHLADFGHGSHLLLLLFVVIVTSLRLGVGPASVVLGIGTVGCLTAAMLSRDVAELTGIGIRLALYLAAGGAYLVVFAGAIRLRQRGAVRAPVIVGDAMLAEELTAREVAVLRLAAGGMNLPEIAQQLYLSPNTVKTHLSHAYGKLGVRNRQAAIRAAVHHGWLDFADLCPHRSAEIASNG